VVQSRKSTRKLPRRGRRIGKGEKIRRKQPLHINANILTTIVIIANIDGHNEEKGWKLHLELNPKNCKKDRKKKNLLATDSSNQVESSSDVDENIVYTYYAEGGEFEILHHHEEKEMTKLFHINIHVKKTKIDVMFRLWFTG
jgi:hypothetical protein